MPIIVDEVVISVEVANWSPCGGAGAPAAADIAEDLVRQCVERVLEILREREER